MSEPGQPGTPRQPGLPGRPAEPGRLAEPRQPAEPGQPALPRFVLHEHRKPQHHFDLRLEEDGVLRSWAVPRGLPTDTKRNKLAVHVDDHALDHVDYQDADKSIADEGTWEEHDRTDRRILFTLHGRESSRRYALIKTDSDWLLHLTKDQPAG